MIYRSYEDENERAVLELDEEAIGYLIEGLEELRDNCEPGEELTTPSFVHEEDPETTPVAMSHFVLKRA